MHVCPPHLDNVQLVLYLQKNSYDFNNDWMLSYINVIKKDMNGNTLGSYKFTLDDWITTNAPCTRLIEMAEVRHTKQVGMQCSTT